MRIESKEPLESPPPDRSWLTMEKITDVPDWVKIGTTVGYVIAALAVIISILLGVSMVIGLIYLLRFLMLGI